MINVVILYIYLDKNFYIAYIIGIKRSKRIKNRKKDFKKPV